MKYLDKRNRLLERNTHPYLRYFSKTRIVSSIEKTTLESRMVTYLGKFSNFTPTQVFLTQTEVTCWKNFKVLEKNSPSENNHDSLPIPSSIYIPYIFMELQFFFWAPNPIFHKHPCEKKNTPTINFHSKGNSSISLQQLYREFLSTTTFNNYIENFHKLEGASRVVCLTNRHKKHATNKQTHKTR